MPAVRQALRQVARLRANEQKALGYDEEELFNELLLRLGTDPRQAVLRMVAGKCSSHSLAQLIEQGAEIDAPMAQPGHCISRPWSNTRKGFGCLQRQALA